MDKIVARLLFLALLAYVDCHDDEMFNAPSDCAAFVAGAPSLKTDSPTSGTCIRSSTVLPFSTRGTFSGPQRSGIIAGATT